MKNFTLLFVLIASFSSSVVQVVFGKTSSLPKVTIGSTIVPNPTLGLHLNPGFRTGIQATASALVFNKLAGLNSGAGQFFSAQTSNDLHYIWLNLTGANGLFSQMAFGYRIEASNGVDDFDSNRIDGQFTLNTLIDASADDYVIQSRALPFSMDDVVHLSAKFPVSGTFTINVDQTLGMFSSGQDIILRDKITGTTHNLAVSSYTFSASAGYVTNRFDIAYQNALSSTDLNYQNDVVVYKNNSNLMINASNQLITEVSIHDIQGRLLVKKSNMNQNEVEIPISFGNQMLVVTTTLQEGQVITKKLMQ